MFWPLQTSSLELHSTLAITDFFIGITFNIGHYRLLHWNYIQHWPLQTSLLELHSTLAITDFFIGITFNIRLEFVL